MLVEMIQKKAMAMLKGIDKNLYIDDVCWNDTETVVQFVVMNDDRYCGKYRFCYDPEDVFERSMEEQVNDWIEELAYRF